jgi:putative acetyltransferase
MLESARSTIDRAMIAIRPETPADIAPIRDVNRRAFGQDQEADLVDALRTNGGSLLSLVAEQNGEVMGHILYSPLVIGSVVGAALGPMAVVPEHQRHGIGTLLVEEGHRRLKQSRCPCVAVVGHPGFYPRFGFRPASLLGITCEWDLPDEVFMVLVLDAAMMSAAAGMARYRPEFSAES